MEGESYPPKERHDMAEPPHSNLKYTVVEHNSYRIKKGNSCKEWSRTVLLLKYSETHTHLEISYLTGTNTDNKSKITDLTVCKKMLTESQSNTLKHSTMMFCQHVK